MLELKINRGKVVATETINNVSMFICSLSFGYVVNQYSARLLSSIELQF